MFAVRAILIMVAMLPAGAARGSQADRTGDPNRPFEGSASFTWSNFLVSGDRGRFRKDRWTTDGNTGGLEALELRSRQPDDNGYEWLIKAAALYDYDYDLSILAKKKDAHYLLLEFTGLRRYFDGSNEPWNAPAKSLVERSDAGLFVDRRTYNVEFGITPETGPRYTFGWHRLVKDGKEPFLRGAAGTAAGGRAFSSVPIFANLRGITDTFYAEAAYTLAEKYNLRIRQEFEQYREDRRFDTSSYDVNGAVDDSDIVLDALGYTNRRTTVLFDSFLDEENYVTAGYMYNYLTNNSTRDVIGYHELTTADGGNSRRSNVGTFGWRRDRLASVDHLSLMVGLRVEDSHTEARMSGTNKYYNFMTHQYDGPKPRIVNSELDDVPVTETLRLIYGGIDKTTLSFDAELEQRAMRWSERDRHGGVLSDPDLSRKADVDITRQVYTFKAVRRLNADLRTTVRFRMSDIEHDSTDLLDDTAYYPGWLDSYRVTDRDLSVSADWRIDTATTATLLYRFIQESIDTSIGGKTQNLEIHRAAGSLSFSPTARLFVVTAFALENYDLDTPAVGVAANHAQGDRPFDFRGTSYSLTCDGSYAFNGKASCTFGVQHTEALGAVDFAGDYAFDSARLMLQYKCSPDKTVGLGYQFVSFNNHDGGFDDYTAHGVIINYTYTF
jgi:hypothetical protein